MGIQVFREYEACKQRKQRTCRRNWVEDIEHAYFGNRCWMWKLSEQWVLNLQHTSPHTATIKWGNRMTKKYRSCLKNKLKTNKFYINVTPVYQGLSCTYHISNHVQVDKKFPSVTLVDVLQLVSDSKQAKIAFHHESYSHYNNVILAR